MQTKATPAAPTVRPVRTSDAQAMRDFVQQGLGASSRRNRFHAAVGHCSDRLAAQLVGADGQRHVAWVACVPNDEGGDDTIIGEARYVVVARADTAELAVSVADAWQGSGVAELLMQALLRSARMAELCGLYGDVLKGNQRMQGLMRRHGFAASASDAQDADCVRLACVVRRAPARPAAPLWWQLVRTPTFARSLATALNGRRGRLMSVFTRLALATTLVASAATAHAALVSGQGTWETTLRARDISGNAVALSDTDAAFFYDTTLNVTWLANMNQDGLKNWGAANAWAAALSTGGFTDWRLPTVIDSGSPGCNHSYAGGTDCGYNVQTQVGSAYSEWAHLFYVTLGNLSYCPSGDATCFGGPQPGWGLSNTAYFQGMESFGYWSGTEYVSHTSGAAWGFSTWAGTQGNVGTSTDLYAVAVRAGDVLRRDGTVPEPRTLALALIALAGLGMNRRRCHAA